MLGVVNTLIKCVAVVVIIAACMLVTGVYAEGLEAACAHACCRFGSEPSPLTLAIRRLVARVRAGRRHARLQIRDALDVLSPLSGAPVLAASVPAPTLRI